MNNTTPVLIELANTILVGTKDPHGLVTLDNGCNPAMLYGTPIHSGEWNPATPRRVRRVIHTPEAQIVVLDPQDNLPDTYDASAIVLLRDNNTYLDLDTGHPAPQKLPPVLIGRDELAYYEGPLVVACDASFIHSNQICLCVATSDVQGMTDPWLFVVITKTEYMDVCAGLLDIGWLFRNLPVYLYDCGTQAPMHVVVLRDHPRQLVLDAFDVELLPDLDFFVDPRQSHWNTTPLHAYPRCATCGDCRVSNGDNHFLACYNTHVNADGVPMPHGLSYQYDEGGEFYVGAEFGCVNHTSLRNH